MALVTCFRFVSGCVDGSLRVYRIVPDDEEIMYLAQIGDIAGVQRLFACGHASPFTVNSSWGVPLLNYAVQGKHSKLCRLLLDQGADPYEVNKSGVSALDRAWDMILNKAAPTEDECSLQSVFGLWHDSEWFEDQQFPRLHKIVLDLSGQGTSRQLRSYLECSAADIDIQDAKGRTTLAWAAARGDEQAVRTLLNYRANVNLPCTTGNTPLLRAARSKSIACTELILDAGATVNWQSAQGFTALHYAVYYQDDPDVVKLLVQSGAELDLQDSYGWSPLACAAEKDRPESLAVLLANGGDIEVPDKENWTPLLRARLGPQNASSKESGLLGGICSR
ncbi:hypothetical protein LTR81_015330 [Elasticomyces elasticus]